MNKNVKLTVYADHTRNKISKNIFGHFMEHSADVIYGSVYDPESRFADEDGFRKDVLEVLKEVQVPMLRYPGGNFVSNYHWEDGIGPKEKRPKVFDYAWLAEDDNRMGTVEFIKLCEKTGAEPYLCVNMGSGTAEEAMHWVEFCNGTGDTKYANMRRELGYEEPFHVKYWGLGNEMYGDWQFGACSAEEYAKKALDFAKAMKWMDPSIELVACGYDLGSDWNYEVARVLKPLISHIAIHHYSIGYDIFKEEDYSVSEEFIKEMEDLVQVYGLYFLYDQDKNLIYIGKSRNLNERIPSSVKERKAYYLKYKLTKTLTDTHILELYYIAKLKPILNKDSKENDDTTLTIEYSFKKESDFIKIRGDK